MSCCISTVLAKASLSQSENPTATILHWYISLPGTDTTCHALWWSLLVRVMLASITGFHVALLYKRRSDLNFAHTPALIHTHTHTHYTKTHILHTHVHLSLAKHVHRIFGVSMTYWKNTMLLGIQPLNDYTELSLRSITLANDTPCD